MWSNTRSNPPKTEVNSGDPAGYASPSTLF
jgi:hypothetical protein